MANQIHFLKEIFIYLKVTDRERKKEGRRIGKEERSKWEKEREDSEY